MSHHSHYPPYRTALVTGASSGIGAEFARALARRGTDLLLVARSSDVLERMARDLAAEHNVVVHVIARDLTGPDAVGETYAETERLGLTVDLLVNNAGFGTAGAFDEIEPERVDREVNLNVGALVGMTRAYLPGMVARGRGGIVNVASIAAFGPAPFMAVYAASKAFVLSFSEALRAENRDRGIQVLAFCPGPVRSRFQEVAGIPSVLGHPHTPQQVVEPALRTLERGRARSIVGFRNIAMVTAMKFLPRRIVVGIAGRFMLRALSRRQSSMAERGDLAADRRSR
jgi:uncharacterized protein